MMQDISWLRDSYTSMKYISFSWNVQFISITFGSQVIQSTKKQIDLFLRFVWAYYYIRKFSEPENFHIIFVCFILQLYCKIWKCTGHPFSGVYKHYTVWNFLCWLHICSSHQWCKSHAINLEKHTSCTLALRWKLRTKTCEQAKLAEQRLLTKNASSFDKSNKYSWTKTTSSQRLLLDHIKGNHCSQVSLYMS